MPKSASFCAYIFYKLLPERACRGSYTDAQQLLISIIIIIIIITVVLLEAVVVFSGEVRLGILHRNKRL